MHKGHRSFFVFRIEIATPKWLTFIALIAFLA